MNVLDTLDTTDRVSTVTRGNTAESSNLYSHQNSNDVVRNPRNVLFPEKAKKLLETVIYY